MTETKVSDKAAQAKKASTDAEARKADALTIRDDPDNTLTASELASAEEKVLGDNPERQFAGRPLTADQMAVAQGNDPVHEPVESEGKQIAIGDRVMLHTANPIAGQTVTPALVIGFTPAGLANLRLEFTDGARANAAGQEYGGIPQNVANEERGSFWTWPEEQGDKPSSKK